MAGSKRHAQRRCFHSFQPTKTTTNRKPSRSGCEMTGKLFVLKSIVKQALWCCEHRHRYFINPCVKAKSCPKTISVCCVFNRTPIKVFLTTLKIKNFHLSCLLDKQTRLPVRVWLYGLRQIDIWWWCKSNGHECFIVIILCLLTNTTIRVDSWHF